MRSGTRGLVCTIVLVALCAPVSAQVVRWTDERGEVHITEGMENVPERHRGGAEVLSKPRPPAIGGSPTGPGAGDVVAPVARGAAAVRFRPGEPIMAIARINGSAVVSLMIDTGATVTAIHSSVMRALGVDLREAPTVSIYGVGGARNARVVVLDRLEVGEATVAPLRVVVVDIGLPGQGVIGQDFLRHFAVNMDNRAGLLTLQTR